MFAPDKMLNFKSILEWLNVNKLSRKANKAKFMLFHHPQRKVDYLSLKLNINWTRVRIQFCLNNV